MLETLVKQLSSNYKFPYEFFKEPSRHYILKIDEDTALIFKELEKGFLIQSALDATPKENVEELFLLLLKANFLGQGTKGSYLALNESGETLLFMHEQTNQLNYPQFKEKIEEFVNYLNYWKLRVKEEIKKNQK